MSWRNGAIEESEDTTNTSKVVRIRRSSESDQNISLEEFRGFEKVPLVSLPRYDITPYINKLNNNNKNVKSIGFDASAHSMRLAQKCTVKLVDEDLIQIKNTLLNGRRRRLSSNSLSDSEDDDMANIKCKICEKGYSSERKLLKHQENKHMIVYKPHDKPPKRVSFSDHVIIHEVKEYHKCRKCPKIFESYNLLKLHMKELHKKQTDMLQHKWTHFLKTTDNSQIRNKSAKKKMKTTYRNGDTIPDYLNPKLVLKKLEVDVEVHKEDVEFVEFVDVQTVDVQTVDVQTVDVQTVDVQTVDVQTIDITDNSLKKPIVDPKSKKTIISRHQCQICDKYLSSNYCLNRHMETQHLNYDNLQCKVCEETFVWPSLLRSHKCIRLNHPEMPFEDARPEIHFDNLQEIGENSFDDLNIGDNDDYLNMLDFEIPAPIVELTEYDSFSTLTPDKFAPLNNLGYKVVMQEVPIEF